MAPQTKSFIVLIIIALFGVGASLKVWSNSAGRTYNYGYYNNKNNYQEPKTANPYLAGKPAPPLADTSAWETYSNKDYKLSFKYKPGWKILPPAKKNGFTVLQVDPGKKYYNINIYISPKEFYILDGLPAKSESLGGAAALNVNNALYGIMANNSYYTFDVGLSMSLVPDFNVLVHSAKFQ